MSSLSMRARSGPRFAPQRQETKLTAVTNGDAGHLAENVTGFFAILAESARAELNARRTILGSPSPLTTGRQTVAAETIVAVMPAADADSFANSAHGSR